MTVLQIELEWRRKITHHIWNKTLAVGLEQNYYNKMNSKEINFSLTLFRNVGFFVYVRIFIYMCFYLFVKMIFFFVKMTQKLQNLNRQVWSFLNFLNLDKSDITA